MPNRAMHIRLMDQKLPMHKLDWFGAAVRPDKYGAAQAVLEV